MSFTTTDAEAYIKVLDEEYAAGAKTAGLNVNPAFVQAVDDSGTFKIPKISSVGYGNYSTVNGFPDGNATFAWVSYTYTQDRGRAFGIDKVQNLEAANMAFGALSSQFVRTHEVKEIDAYRIAKIYTDHAHFDASGALTDAAGTVAALNAGLTAMEENEVESADIICYITPTLARLVRTQGSTAAVTDVFDRCTVVEVPKTRMYTAIDLNDGADASGGGYAKGSSAKDINFMLVDRNAVFADAKHVAVRIFSPAGEEGLPVNPHKDGWEYQLRMFHDCWLFDQKKEKGVYAHTVS